METRLAFVEGLARQAGGLLLDYFTRSDLQTQLKADRSVVTEADLAADRLIAAAIRERFPGETLLSEELQPTLSASQSASQSASPSGSLSSQGETPEAVWIIDPLDGTTNFSLGLHIWGVLIARLVSGRPDTAVLYFPRLEELYAAQRGEGAFLNGRPLQTQPPQEGKPTAFFSCCSRTYRRYRVSLPYKPRILGSASYSFCAVARGMALIGFEATPKIWDIAAAWLLVEEAGGIIETLDGSRPFPLHPGLPYASQSFPTLAAATPGLAAQAHRQIQLRE